MTLEWEHVMSGVNVAAGAVENGSDDGYVTWPKWIVIGVALFGVFGSHFLEYLLPSVVFWLFLAGLIALLPLLIFSLEALFKRRWRSVAIFAIVGMLACLPLSSRATVIWLRGQGFHFLTLLDGDYLAKCKLSDFVEGGIKQTVGFCEGFDRGDHFDFVVYDTAGEVVLPVPQRTPEWKRTMLAATEKAVVSEDGRADRLFGNYYSVVIWPTDPRY
jgi:hypothetical protein